MKSFRTPLLMIIMILSLALFLAACGGKEEPTPTPEPPPPTAVPEPTDTPEPEPTAVPEPTEEPTAVPEPTEEPEPTAVPEPTDVPAPDFQEFSSDEAGLTVGYPADWSADTSSLDFLVFATSDELLSGPQEGMQGAVVAVLPGNLADFESTDAMGVLAEMIAQLSMDDAEVVDGPTAVTINGLEGATDVLHIISDSGTPQTAKVTVVTNGERVAIMVGTTPTETEDDYLDAFTALAASISLREPTAVAEPDGGGEIALGESEGFLLYGDAVTGTLTEGAPVSWDFIGLEGEVVDISVEPLADNLDVVLDVQDDAGNSVLEFPLDDSCGAEELLGFEIPASGTYLIVISGYDDTTGDYQLTLAEAGSANVGTGGDIAEGDLLEMSKIYQGTMDGVNSVTWLFAGKAGEFADITVSPIDNDLDVVLDVLDPSGFSLLDEPLDNSFDAEYIRILRLPEDGVYTVVVSSFDGAAGDYEMLVEESYLSQPATFVFASYDIDDAETVHDFPFTTFAGELVVTQVMPDLDLDVVLGIYNDDTDELIEEIDDSTGFEEAIFVAPDDGNYLFRVSGYEGSTGAYDINLIGSETVCFELAPGYLVIGRFGDKNLFEYYIGGAAGEQVTFTAKTEDDVDLILQLTDFDGNIIASVDDGFTGDEEVLVYTFETDGLLILQVSDFMELGSGEFLLSVD